MDNVKRLPDAYYKGKDGNNYKLLHLNELAADEFANEMENVNNSLDIMQATGRTLDLFGASVGIRRENRNDSKYRLAILTQIGRNISDGSYDKILTLLAHLFNCEESDIIIRETDISGEIEVVSIPFEVINNAGYSVKDAVNMMESLLAICVRVKKGFFEGTFEFGDGYDENTGFGNIEQTKGGFLGRLYY